MLVITAFCDKDAALAVRMFEWCAELDGVQNHPCVLVASKGMDESKIIAVRIAAQTAFNSVSIIRPTMVNERGWPESPNFLFRTTCDYVAKVRKTPFLWLEPDCTPLRYDWLNAIESEYIAAGKPYMGFVWGTPHQHMTGVAVYPSEVAKFNPLSLKTHRNSQGPLPFDVVDAKSTLKHAHATNLIFHEWGKMGVPPTFPTMESTETIPSVAVLYHRVKDGSLIDRLREKQQPKKPTIIERASSVITKLVNSVPIRPSVDVLYICVRSPSEPNVPRNFRESHERFVSTYKKFKPSIPHRLIVVCYNGKRDAETDELFAGLNPEYMYYNGTGFDIGTYLTIGRNLDSDFVLLCGSNVHFHQPGWLERMVEAFVKHGEGAYAPMASYEFAPHLRTCCIATTPNLLRRYPHTVQTRLESYMFESGQWNYTRWIQGHGLPALMVMRDGELAQPDWRKPPNIFRRGDQSNCIIWDRHTMVYANSDEADKKNLARMADGGTEIISLPVAGERKRYKTITVVAATSLNAVGHAKAIERTASLIPYPCEKLLICSQSAPKFTGTQLPLPEPWAKDGKWSIHDMANFTLFGLHKYIKTDVAVMVHDDGYALNRSRWTDEFLDWDYIGAPWPKALAWVKPDCRVGNGGFSLRSKRWLERASELYPLPQDFSEDVFAGVVHRDHFTHSDCRIAPIDVAMKWSFEHVIEEFPKWKLGESFGFHGIAKVTPLRKHLLLK